MNIAESLFDYGNRSPISWGLGVAAADSPIKPAGEPGQQYLIKSRPQRTKDVRGRKRSASSEKKMRRFPLETAPPLQKLEHAQE